MANSKTISILMYDLKNTTENSKNFIIKESYKYIVAEPLKHGLTKLVLFNSHSQNTGVPNLRDLNPDQFGYHLPGDFLDQIEVGSQTCAPGVDCSLPKALNYCIRQLHDARALLKGAANLQIIFITELGGALVSGPIGNLRQYNGLNGFFFALTPEVRPPFYVASYADIRRWLTELDVSGSASLAALKRVALKFHRAVICEPRLGVDLTLSFRNWPYQSHFWREPLRVGSRVRVPCQVALGAQRLAFVREKARPGRFARFVKASDRTAVVPEASVVRGLSRHGRWAAMPAARALAPASERCFALVGFTQPARVPDHLLMGDVAYVLPLRGPSARAFEALVQKVARAGLVGVAVRVYNKNQNPRLVALIPRVDVRPKHFVLNTIAYAEYLRGRFTLGGVAGERVEVTEEVKSFLDGSPVGRKFEVDSSLALQFDEMVQLNVVAKAQMGELVRPDRLDKDYSSIVQVRVPDEEEPVAGPAPSGGDFDF